MADGETFNPQRHITKVGPADYLPVMWRLVWFREDSPDGVVITELIEHKAGEYAVFKATVTKSAGGGVATGYGSETKQDFRDYLEKAETKAIGRALAALGFGTQFSAHEFGGEADSGRIVDAPVDSGIDFASARGRRMQNTMPNGNNGGPGASQGQPATPRQLKFIQAIAREHGMDDDVLNAETMQLYGRPVGELDRREASAYIERLQSVRPPVTSLVPDGQPPLVEMTDADRFTR